jgi:hypothetical protein
MATQTSSLFIKTFVSGSSEDNIARKDVHEPLLLIHPLFFLFLHRRLLPGFSLDRTCSITNKEYSVGRLDTDAPDLRYETNGAQIDAIHFKFRIAVLFCGVMK